MSASASPGAYGPGAYRSGPAPGGWGPASRGPDRGFDPWSFVWAVPKPLLIAAIVVGFIVLWPVGLAVLAFLFGTGRLGGRWARRHAMQPSESSAGGCGWRGWRREEPAPSSGNHAFDEYRLDTLRRLEEEQRDFAGFLERLRFAKDKAEFDQFMSERRQRPPQEPTPPQG